MEPSRFREELKRFDRSLDFVFNGKKSRWEIVGTDLKRHKYLIKSFNLGQIGTAGLDTIRVMAEVSPVKNSAKVINQRIDHLIEEEEKADKKQREEVLRSRADEAWDHYQYAEGHRVFFSATPQKEAEFFVVTDKRRANYADPEPQTVSSEGGTTKEGN